MVEPRVVPQKSGPTKNEGNNEITKHVPSFVFFSLSVGYSLALGRALKFVPKQAIGYILLLLLQDTVNKVSEVVKPSSL